MPLRRDIGLGPSDIVLDGDPPPRPKTGTQPPPSFRPMSIVVKRSPMSAVAEHLWSLGGCKRIRGFTMMRYRNLRFTSLLTGVISKKFGGWASSNHQPMLLMPLTMFSPSICTKRELAPAEFVEPLKIASFETESIFVLHRVK